MEKPSRAWEGTKCQGESMHSRQREKSWQVGIHRFYPRDNQISMYHINLLLAVMALLVLQKLSLNPKKRKNGIN